MICLMAVVRDCIPHDLGLIRRKIGFDRIKIYLLTAGSCPAQEEFANDS